VLGGGDNDFDGCGFRHGIDIGIRYGEKMPAIIKHHINFIPKSVDDALLQPGELTTAEAAALAACTTENIRLWVRKHRIGHWEPRLQMFIINREKLVARMKRRKKPLA
jgi:hypothetical protein